MKRILAAADQSITDARAMVNACHAVDSAGHYVRQDKERILITNACFLGLFISLEEFLEASFPHYLIGRMSTNRWRPGKYGRPRDATHAHEMLKGNQRFIDWSTPDTVIKLADLYFKQGEPFRIPIVSSLAHLNRMKKVRNATAHMSVTTQNALDSVYSQWTGTPQSNVSAYDTLMSIGATSSDTFYTYSEKTVQTIMQQIGNHV
jgi:hypothetical protein